MKDVFRHDMMVDGTASRGIVVVEVFKGAKHWMQPQALEEDGK